MQSAEGSWTDHPGATGPYYGTGVVIGSLTDIRAILEPLTREDPKPSKEQLPNR